MIKATRTVYCYYFPEIRKLITELTKKYPHEIFLQSIKPGLDDFHKPVIEKLVNYYSSDIPALKDFKYAYFTSGASEGIFHILVKLKKENTDVLIYVLKGEYEGYKAYGENIGLNVIEVDINVDPKTLKQGVWFVSNPSARNGNIFEDKTIKRLCNAGHKVVVDCTYVGLTSPHKFDLSHNNIIAVIFPFSKPFGVYYYRIGFTFTRNYIPTLEPNKWFKNILSLIIADKIMSTFKPYYFYHRYKKLQRKIIKRINNENNLGLKASDVILLAHKQFEREKDLEIFRRGDFIRMCLTPYFLEEECNSKSL